MAARLQSDTQRTWLVLLALTLIYALSVAAATQWPLQISADGRSLEERDGTPHFPIIDTVWQLSYLNQADVDLYLSRRPAQGFNAVFVSLLGVENLPHGRNSTNDNGHMPFAGSVGAPDTRRPNPAFFDDFKATLRKLREKNMTVFLVLGWASAWQESFSRESYRRYVEFVLDAYPADEFPHVVFCLGGDKGMLRQKNLDKPMQIEAGRHLRQLMNARGDRRLLSDHPGRGSTIINYAPEERAGWSDILVVQSGHRAPTQDVPDWVRQAYEASPAAPVFNGEPLYESHNPGLENAEVRWAHWVSVFSGACAVGYGGHGFWGIGADVPARPTRPGHSRDWWKAHLEDQPVASQVRHFSALNQAYPFRLAAPDFALNQPLVQHRGQGAAYTAALVARDRSWALVYLPQQPGIAEVALRMDALRAPARLRWFDPTSGAFRESTERIPNRGSQVVKGPGNNRAGQRDWVLALEAAPEIVGAAPPPSDPARGRLVLARDGRAGSVIVTADQPSAAAREAARDLQMWIEKASGALITIQPESRLPRESRATRILVGDSRAVRALGLDPSTFDLEEIRIQTFPDTLVIIGDDERPDGVPLRGTLWAAETFAEQRLGVRVLWPGELGLAVPKTPTIELDAIDDRFAPVLRKRSIRNIGYNERIQTGLDRLGWNAEEFKRHATESELWFRFHRIGGSFVGGYGHAYGTYWDRFSAQHPEWFALQPDGTRDQRKAQNGARAQLCVSNRGLIEQVARDAIESLRRNPAADCVSLSPNDGAAVTHCLCPNCEAWDAPGGETIEMWGPKEPTRHVSLSDRYVRFYSEVAAIVAREVPGRNLGAYAYSVYRLPPLREKLHPSVILGFVGFSYLNESNREQSRDAWQRWSEMASRIFLRPNALSAGMGSPTVHAHRLADDLRFCLERKMMACDFDCCYQHWASDGLNYYVLAKLLWDPGTDVDAAIADYCRAGFGPAAGAIGEYFRLLETNLDSFARFSAARKPGKDEVAPFAEWTRDEFFVRCHALLDRAAREAGGDETIRQRVGFLRKAVELGEIRHRYWIARAAAKNGDRQAAQRAKQIEEERMKWYQALGISWAINAPNLEFYRGRF